MNNNDCLALLCLAAEDSGLEDRAREAVAAYRPTPRQWRAAHALARAHGHWWAGEKPPAGSIGEVVAALFAAATENDMGGVAPMVDRFGNLTHTTATGRLSWRVAPSGAVKLSVTRKGDIECLNVSVTDGGAVSAAFVPEACRARHWQAALDAVSAVGGAEARAALLRLAPTVYRQVWAAADALVDAATARVEAVDALLEADAELRVLRAAFLAARDVAEASSNALIVLQEFDADVSGDDLASAHEAHAAKADASNEALRLYWDLEQLKAAALGRPELSIALEAAREARQASLAWADLEVDAVTAPRTPARPAPVATPEGFKPWGGRRAKHVGSSA